MNDIYSISIVLLLIVIIHLFFEYKLTCTINNKSITIDNVIFIDAIIVVIYLLIKYI